MLLLQFLWTAFWCLSVGSPLELCTRAPQRCEWRGELLLISLLTSPSPEFHGFPSLPRAFSTWTTLLYSTCPAHRLQPTPDLYLSFLILPGAFSFTNPPFPSSSFPIPPSTSPEIADILHSGISLLSPPLFFIHPPPPFTADVINEGGGTVGSSFACPWGTLPRASHLCVCNSLPVCCCLKNLHPLSKAMNVYLFIYVSLYLFIYLLAAVIKPLSDGDNLGPLDVSQGWSEHRTLGRIQRWVSEKWERVPRGQSIPSYSLSVTLQETETESVSVLQVPASPVSPLHPVVPYIQQTHICTLTFLRCVI